MSADTEALDADGLLEEAQRQTGLDDLGAAALPTIVLTNLTNRLRVVEHLKQHPQAADEPIEAPVVVIGLFRAGTTLLSQLLDLDPGARSLLGWESQDVATRWTRVLLESVDRVEDFRRRHPDHPVLDLHYRQLVADPLATVAQVYEFTGRTLEDTTATATREHLAAHPKGGRGVHRYDLADFGLDEAELRSTFAAYSERYGVGEQG